MISVMLLKAVMTLLPASIIVRVTDITKGLNELKEFRADSKSASEHP